MAVTFGELRNLVSRVDRVSIMFDDEALSYKNYTFVEQVPREYDRMLVKGIGAIDSEFPIKDDSRPLEIGGNEIDEERFMGRALEFWLSPMDAGLEEKGDGVEHVSVAERLANFMNRLDAFSREMDSTADDLDDEAGKWLHYAAADVGRALDEVDSAMEACAELFGAYSTWPE